MGTTVAGYRIDARIAQGSMGVVYRGWDVAGDRPVALKFLSPTLTLEPEHRARFAREARALAALEHPSIGRIYEAGEALGHPFLALAFYEAVSLRDRLAQGPLAERELLETSASLAEALAAAHAAGIVHRDVKPSNVLLPRDGGVKLIDFGLARRDTTVGAADLTRGGTFLGTLAYAAPEQIKGERAAAPADVWALGVIACEAASGRHPFLEAAPVGTATRILSVGAHADTLDALPAALRAPIERVLVGRPAARPSAQELAAELRGRADALR